MAQTVFRVGPTEERRFDVDPPKNWQPSIRSQEEVDDLFWDQLLNKGKRATNTFMDFVSGTTPEEEMMSAILAPLTMTKGSPLRDPAYRALMLRRLKAQIDRLEPGGNKDESLRLLKAKPFVMAAFQHAGGRVSTQPGAVNHLGTFGGGLDPRAGWGRPARIRQGLDPLPKPSFMDWIRNPGEQIRRLRSGPVVGLEDVMRNPEIRFTPAEQVQAEWPMDTVAGGRTRKDPYSTGQDTAAHEWTHWAQILGPGPGKAENKVLRNLPDIPDMSWLHDSADMEFPERLKFMREQSARDVDVHEERRVMLDAAGIFGKLGEEGAERGERVQAVRRRRRR